MKPESVSILGNCIDFMKSVPGNHFDLAICDPPYGINANSSRSNISKKTNSITKTRSAKTGNYSKELWAQKVPTKRAFNEIIRVSKNQIVFGANYFDFFQPAFKAPRRKNYEQFLHENPKGWIIWDKGNVGTKFSDCELIKTSFNFDSYVYNFIWSGMRQGSGVFTGHIQIGNQELRQKRIHPTEKPIFLYKYLFHEFLKNVPGAKIIDPYLGSGSSRIAAYEMEIAFTGIECVQKYFNDQELRFKRISRQERIQFPT